MMVFSRKEVGSLLIGAVVLGVVFGFDDKQPVFELGFWLMNLFVVMLVAFLSLVLYEAGHKAVASRLGCSSTAELWCARRFSLAEQYPPLRKGGSGFPLGAAIPLLLTLLSRGVVKCAAVMVSRITPDPRKRLGREFVRLSEFDEARIALSGPLVAVVVAAFGKMVLGSSLLGIQVVSMNALLALWNMVPVPRLDGMKVYFGSPLLYTFSLAFMVVALIMLRVAHAGAALALGLATGVGVFFLHYTKSFIKK